MLSWLWQSFFVEMWTLCCYFSMPLGLNALSSVLLLLWRRMQLRTEALLSRSFVYDIYVQWITTNIFCILFDVLGLYHQCKETFERTNVLCLTYVFLGYAYLFLIMFRNCWLLRFLVLFLCQEWISSAGWCFAWCCRRRHFRFVSLESFIINCYYIIYFEIHGWYCVGIAIWSFCLL